MYRYVDLMPESMSRDKRLDDAFCHIGKRLYFRALGEPFK
jgi:hypothetical protein